MDLEANNVIVRTAASDLALDALLRKLRPLNTKNSIAQIFDQKIIVSEVHLLGSYVNAVLAFKNRTNKTKNLGMETLLFAAMTDQINQAIKIAGAKRSSVFVLLADKKSLKKLDFLEIKSRFRKSAQDMEKSAESIGIKAKGNKKEINRLILQEMAVSRLTD